MKEGAYAEAEGESNASIEQEGSFSKEKIRAFLESRKSVTDSGRSGILFRIDPSELVPDNQEQLTIENEDNSEGALSIKALKVFNLADAQRELSRYRKRALSYWKRSRRLLLLFLYSMFHGQSDLMRSTGSKTQKFLNANGASITNGKVGTITMDWIEGKNLGVYLYEELLKRLPKNENPYQIESWDYADFSKLLRALEKTGFVFPEHMLAQLKNGVKALHDKKLWHNDLHFGNVIVGPDGQLHAIDYADAGHEKKSIEEAEGQYYLSDENIIASLEPLTKTPNIKKREQRELAVKEWDDRIASFEHQPQAKDQYEVLESAVKRSDTRAFEAHLIASSASERNLENYLASLLKLSRENEGYRDFISGFLDERLADTKSKLRSFVLNRIRALQSAVEI